jgi:hypothetical protein
MKLVYIAAPYRADTPEETERNRQAALAACEEAYRIGRVTGEMIVPVTPTGAFPYLDGDKPEEREQAHRMGMAMLSKCDEMWCAGDHISERTRAEIRAAIRLGKPVYSMGVAQAAIQNAISDMPPMLSERQCVYANNSGEYTGRLLILKPSALAPWALEPENQLWVATHGFGCRPTALGRAVYAVNLYDGEKARFDRSDFFGVADTRRLTYTARDLFREYKEQQENLNENEELEL